MEVICTDYSNLINIFTFYINNTFVALSKLYKTTLNGCICWKIRLNLEEIGTKLNGQNHLFLKILVKPVPEYRNKTETQSLCFLGIIFAFNE